MAYTTIDDPSQYFQTVTYTGNGSQGHAITFDGNSDLQPDWLWGKERSQGGNHNLFDTSRGLDKRLTSDQVDAENTDSTTVTAMNTNGFTLGSSSNINESGVSTVAWCWKCNGGTTSSNSSGSITSTVQTNTTAGFSIVTYTGTGSAATIGHGLGVTPDLIIVKTRNNNVDWQVYLDLFGNDDEGLFLNLNNAKFNSTNYWNNGATNSVFGVSSNTGVGANSYTYVAYCFASIQGYSKIGSYTGNGNADGPFVYTGFKPAWVLIKRSDGGSENWNLNDNKRSPINPTKIKLSPNTNGAEAEDTGYSIDFVSNGFKIRNDGGDHNSSGATYIYMAFAEHPFVSSEGVPVTAR